MCVFTVEENMYKYRLMTLLRLQTTNMYVERENSQKNMKAIRTTCISNYYSTNCNTVQIWS